MDLKEKISLPIISRVKWGEDVLSLTAFLAMAALPCIEIFARLIKQPGIPGSSVIVQHLTLWIMFLGAILAARENKLLSLTGPIQKNRDEEDTLLIWFSRSVAIGVCLFLTWASFQLVKAEMASPRDVLPGVPVWVVQSIMPIGFFIIGIQIFLNSSRNTLMRALLLSAVVLVGAIGLGETLKTPLIVAFGISSLVGALVLGSPIFVGLGGMAVLLFWFNDVPIAAIPAETYRIVVSPTLPTIPLFTLTGYLLAEGGASKRLINVFKSWVSWLPGGTPVIVALICGFFTAITGGSGVTILALGGLLLPMLLEEKYPLPFAIGLITVSGSLGLLFPPSLPVIIYGVTAGVPINKIFLVGFIPGLFLVLVVALWGIRQGIISKVKPQKFQLKKALSAAWKAKWELALPAIVLVGIFGGFATLVEVAAFTLIYVLIIESFVYKDLELNDIPRIVIDCATLVGGVLIILGVAMGLTSFLVDAQVPMLVMNWVSENIQNKFVFLLILNVFLLIVGCLMDIFSAIIVVVPLIKGVAAHFGIDPVHLAIIFIANLELGYLTPPVGMNLFLSAYRFNKSMPEVYKSTLPFFVIMLIGVLAITYVPILFPQLF